MCTWGRRRGGEEGGGKGGRGNGGGGRGEFLPHIQFAKISPPLGYVLSFL